MKRIAQQDGGNRLLDQSNSADCRFKFFCGNRILLVKFYCKNAQVEAAPADREAREDFNKFVREILDQNTNNGGQNCSRQLFHLIFVRNLR